MVKHACVTAMTNSQPDPYAPTNSDLGHQADGAELTSADRTLALIDQVIGLQAELAEERYRHDRELEGLETRTKELQESLDEANKQASDVATRLGEVLASRSWRLGQVLIRPAHLVKSRLNRLR
jgi:hypothetical protein